MSTRRAFTPLRLAALVILAGFLIVALIGPSVGGEKAETIDLRALTEGSSAAHPLGTDALGRDMLARTLVATRLSLVLAAAVSVSAFFFGVLLGVVPLLMGRRAQRWGASVINLLCAFPSILLALLVITIVGVGWAGAVVALAAAGAPQIARVTQTLAAQVSQSNYVTAARGAGVSTTRLITRHVLPNIGSALVLQLAWAMGTALLALSALSFLGVGVQEPSYDWGSLLSAGLERIYDAPAAAMGPAVAVVLVSLCFNVLGDLLADSLSTDAPLSPPRRRLRRPLQDIADPAVGHEPDDAPLRVEGLSVMFDTPEGTITPVRDVSLVLRAGERLGIVGESGSGKSLTLRAGAQLIESPGTVAARLITINGAEVSQMPPSTRARHVATSVAMVFQDPLGSFNPARRLGTQITEGAEVHLGLTRSVARERAAERFRELGIAGGARRLQQYPHEFSGGMRQRAVIAMGLMTEPRVILADEPTSALDVTVQRQVLRKLRKVNDERGTAVLLVSHDVSVVAAFCERVLVMYAGRVVEELAADRLDEAAHPYTRALLAAVPTMHTDRDRPLVTVPGQPPTVGDLPDACAFAARCQFATDRCHAERPTMTQRGSQHRFACWHPQPGPAERVEGVST